MRVSPDLRPAIVGFPSYLASHPHPTSPADLTGHRCFRFRHGSGDVYRWELDKGDQSLVVAVDGPLIVNDVDLVIRAILDGVGLAWLSDDRVGPYLATAS